MKLSVVIPARDEQDCVAETLARLLAVTQANGIPCEVLVVDDGSRDATAARVSRFAEDHPEVRLLENPVHHGYGFAVRCGLRQATGDAVAVMMADGSDHPEDLAAYYAKLREGYDCVFGSRFCRGGRVEDYPAHKLILNRLANWFIAAAFGLRFTDVTNAFKCYRRRAIEGMQPLISSHFNLTVEMPLKAVVRGYSYTVVPIRWTNRKTGVSKLKIKEMGSRYLFIVLYLWLEKHLARADYHRRASEQTEGARESHV